MISSTEEKVLIYLFLKYIFHIILCYWLEGFGVFLRDINERSLGGRDFSLTAQAHRGVIAIKPHCANVRGSPDPHRQLGCQQQSASGQGQGFGCLDGAWPS